MLPVLQIGPLALQLPGLILLIALWGGLSFSEKHGGKRGILPDTMYNLVFYSLVAGVFGARLAYAGRYPEAFMHSPKDLISLNPGLLDPFGGIVTGLVAGLIYGQRKRLAFWPTLDALTPLFATLMIGAALANLSSGKGFGASADLPWSLEIWGARRHPSQVYEAAAGLLVLAAIWPARFNYKKHPAGVYFLRFLVISAIVRLFLEGFRGDSVTIENGFRIVQLAAWSVAAIGLTILWQKLKLRD